MKEQLKVLLAAAAVSSSIISASATAAVMSYTDEATFLAAAGTTTLENFDAAPWVNGTNAQGTSNLGVTWTSADSLFTATSFYRSGPRSLSDVDGSPDHIDQINAAFSGNTFAVGFWLTTFNQGHGVLVELLDANNSVLGSVLGAGTFGNGLDSFVGLVSDAAIAKVRMTSTASGIGDDFAIDDFRFGGKAQGHVPEPASLALLGLGLAGLAASRRSKQ